VTIEDDQIPERHLEQRQDRGALFAAGFHPLRNTLPSLNVRILEAICNSLQRDSASI